VKRYARIVSRPVRSTSTSPVRVGRLAAAPSSWTSRACYHTGGGGAIYTRDVNIHVWGVIFEGNRGPELGPDVAGGAIYAFGAKRIVVANSIFRGNAASNGGALGLLHTSSELYNVLFDNKEALGMLANFAGATGCPVFNHEEQGGAGGLGGAFYSDGIDPTSWETSHSSTQWAASCATRSAERCRVQRQKPASHDRKPQLLPKWRITQSITVSQARF